MNNTAIILGSSGLVGSQLLTLLLNSTAYKQVVLFNRKPSSIKHPKIKEYVIDFNQPQSYKKDIQGDVIFCCLGSTKVKTPNPTDYRKIDFDIPLLFANEAVKKGLQQFHLVSSLGASSLSKTFYLKLKGEVETALKKCNLKSLYIYQPSILLGNRLENRPIERFFLAIIKFLNPLFIGKIKRYSGIQALVVAQAMLNTSLISKKGTHIYTSETIKKLA